MHRCPLLDRRFNRCMQADLASIPSCTKHRSVGSSDNHRMHRCLMRRFFRCNRPKSLTTPIFSFSLSSLEPKSLRMVILTIILVQVLCCHLITKITRNGINGAMFVTITTPTAHKLVCFSLNVCGCKSSDKDHQSSAQEKKELGLWEVETHEKYV